MHKYLRGQIYWLHDVKEYDGSVQGGSRPVIIVSNNRANKFSNNLTIVPCTSIKNKKNLPTHVFLNINEPSIALTEDIQTVSKQRIGLFIGTCTTNIMNEIDNALKIALDLK